MFQFELEGRKEPMFQIKDHQSGRIFFHVKGPILLSYLGLQLIGWGSPTLWRSICFPQSTDLNVNPIQKTNKQTNETLTERPRIIFDQVSWHSVPSQVNT